MSKICVRCDAENADRVVKCRNCGFNRFRTLDSSAEDAAAVRDSASEPVLKTSTSIKSGESETVPPVPTEDISSCQPDLSPRIHEPANPRQLDDIISEFLDSEVQNDMVEAEKRNMKKNKRRRRRWIVWGFIVPALLFAAFLVVLYKFLFGLENYSDEACLKQYIGMIESENYDELMVLSGIELSGFNRKEEFVAYMKNQYGESPRNIKYVRKVSPQGDDAVYYNIQAEGKAVKEIKLEKTGVKLMRWFDEWKVTPSKADFYGESVTIYSPPGVQVFLNGTEVTDDYLIPGKYKEVGQYSVVKDEGYKPPVLLCYEVTDLMAVTSVEVQSTMSCSCSVSQREEGSNTYYVSAQIKGQEAEMFKSLSWEIAKTYADFINEDARRSDINAYLYENTEFYDAIQQFDNYWFPAHDDSGHEGDIVYSDMKWYDENHRSLNIKTTYYVTSNGKRKLYPIDYTMYFMKVDGEWKVTSISYI